jgi:hypothetical protein
VEDDDQDGPFESGECLGFGHALGQAPVAGTEERVGFGRPHSHLPKGSFQVGVPFAGDGFAGIAA